ncbi:hypothetical protein [Weissella paramesenteroides]|uniref:Uncharacterized protein n=1 Tax=Weissella paramesenteroides ATCC 33313 TaxID=585506 RepID=C5RBU1_WEIPA|nr:hypothetical protein [Weissella paramesenteroides]ATF41204.1 hypothetical protein CO680_03720 [Weissella paramesenteroides]EER74336.1 hypothetical protein HMPREF0877_1437 [Weissella paramesenteroides ATCC 33313]
MYYDKFDLINDIAYSNLEVSSDQHCQAPVLNIFLKNVCKGFNLTSFQREILKLSQVTNVGEMYDTPYLSHKSYPSPRSLYTSQLFIIIDGRLISSDSWTGEILEYWSDDLHLSNGDIVIISNPINDSHYTKLQLTLRLLEVGHLIQNIQLLDDVFFNTKFIIDNTYDGVVVLRHSQPDKNYMMDEMKLEQFHQALLYRYSGKYFGGYSLASKQYKMELDIMKLNTDGLLQVQVFENDTDNMCYLNRDNGVSIPYIEMNRLYSFMSARSMNAFYVISIKRNILDARGNIADHIQQVGMCAQNILLHISKPDVFARPMKQMNGRFWQKYIGNDWIPFYGIYAGRYLPASFPGAKVIAR